MKSEIPWRTDESGMLVGPGVHDSRLVKLMISEGCLEFGMRRLSGDIVTIELFGLQEFTVHELCHGAIVSEFWVRKMDSVPETSWAVPDSAWNILFSRRMGIEDAKREAARMALDRPKSLLVQLACSYGGEVAAVCDRIEVSEVRRQTADGCAGK